MPDQNESVVRVENCQVPFYALIMHEGAQLCQLNTLLIKAEELVFEAFTGSSCETMIS